MRNDSSVQSNIGLEQIPDPFVLVIFGASGDLTRRKLLPAMFRLASQALLPERFAILGVASTEWDDAKFREEMHAAVDEFGVSPRKPTTGRRLEPHPEHWDAFGNKLYYLMGDFTTPELHERLAQRLDGLDAELKAEGNFAFYLAVPPSTVPAIVSGLGHAGLARPGPEPGRRRIVIEKPFGRDLESARALNQQVLGDFEEEQIFRIDHYLGKDTVQNLLVFRFANSLFEPVWNRSYVDSVRILSTETLGIEARARYYEEAGVVRDMFQSHLLQMLCLVAMEPPSSFRADVVRNQKVEILEALRHMEPEDVERLAVRGQYGPGTIKGEPAPGYRQEPGVAPESPRETFASVPFFVDNWRWQGVPFYLASGKRLGARRTEIRVRFKKVPHLIFRHTRVHNINPNEIVLRIQPNEGIELRFEAKRPGLAVDLRSAHFEFDYDEAFEGQMPEAYETLLLDFLCGDNVLFARGDEVEASWSAVTPILQVWESQPPTQFPNYAAGSWGPSAAQGVLAPLAKDAQEEAADHTAPSAAGDTAKTPVT